MNEPFKLDNHSRYSVDAYDWCDELDIDISRDDGGWSGCGHPGQISLTRNDLVGMLALLDEVKGAANE